MAGITEIQKTNYLNAAVPNRCPLCGSSDVTGGFGKEALQDSSCGNCDTEWTDSYLLSNITIIERDRKGQ